MSDCHELCVIGPKPKIRQAIGETSGRFSTARLTYRTLAVFWLSVLQTCAAAGVLGAETQQQQQQQREDFREHRAGNIVGLEDGQISLAKVASMLTSSVHMELAGSEDAFRRLLDHEWDQFFRRPTGTRSTFLVCSAPGRANAKRLRELAGADSLVRTLHHRKGEILCSFASLDGASAAFVARDGLNGDEGGQGTFSLEPLPHLAKLSPRVAADPSPAALLLAEEAVALADGSAGTNADGRGGGGGRRHLRAGAENNGTGRSEMSAKQRARVLAAAAAATGEGSAGADRPTTRRLIEDGERGMVDAIEIRLVNHHERRSKSDTEELARRWLSLASDQSALAEALRAEHFWSLQQGQPQEEGVSVDDNVADDGEQEEGRSGGRRLLTEAGNEQEGFSASAAGRQEEETTRRAAERARDLSAHEERKRLGWASLLESVGGGQGLRSTRPAGGGHAEGATAGSCRFDQARFTASPSGTKVLLHRPHEMAAAAAASSGDGGSEDGCLSALLAFVSLQPEVHYVTARRKTATMNIDAAWVTQSGIDGFTPLWDENLQGQNETIGVADTGLDMNHCNFIEDDGDNIEASEWDDPITDTSKRKVVQYIAYVDDFDDTDGHGTHVAGSIAGAQSGQKAGDDDGDGMAYQGKLAVFDFGDSDNSNALTTPDEVDTVILQPAYDGGARIHSNSWDTVDVEYTSLSEEVDEFVYLHQDMLVVFAAGNCGDTTTDDTIDNCNVLDDDEGTVLSPAQAKNVVAVGSSESGGVDGKDMDTVSYFSSKGPTIDGRIKPDVVAPGDPTWSAAADPTGETCEYGIQTGTSMATPIVAGNGAMARQYFREGWYNTGSKNTSLSFEPSAALLKAVLINSATAMSYVGVNPETSTLDVTLSSPPDEHQGFGRVNMINALNINATVGIFFEDWVEIGEGGIFEYEVSLYEDADLDKDLRVTLVWTDPPASVGSTGALIHDLDLVVIAQSTGTEYYPNGGDGPDSVNNVEKVTITDTTEGETYTIRVTCDELSDTDKQNFAVIANGEFIKTNDLPTEQDPSDWADLAQDVGDTLFTWEFLSILALGIFACCAIACACRTCDRSRSHKAKVNRYRREIIYNRGTGGRKLHPNGLRPQPYAGPVRNPGELYIAGSGRLPESFRRPSTRSIGAGSSVSVRSMRSEHRARGALLTGAGAVVPGQYAERTTPSTPRHEACPECGLRLPDVVQLVNHVETQHGGRANRRNAPAAVGTTATIGATPGLKVVKARPVNSSIDTHNRVQVVTVAPSKDVPRRSGNPYADARIAGAEMEAKPSQSMSPRSKYPGPTSRVVVTTATVTAAGAAAASRARSGKSPSRIRSNSPGTSGTSSGSSSNHRSTARRSGDSGSGHSRPSTSSKPEGGRDSLPRIRDVAGPRKNDAKANPAVSDSSGHSGGSPLPRILSLKRGSRGNENGATSRGSTPAVPVRVTSGGGSGSRASRDTSRHSADTRKPSRDGSGSGDSSRRQRVERERVPKFEKSGKCLVKNDSVRSLTRTSSLDRMSALSSRAITRSPKRMNDHEGASAEAANEAARQARSGDHRRILRVASTEDHIPSGQRLTAEGLRALGSPTPAFSPVVKRSAKEPAYSPVARERAGELDEDRRESLTRKFFRQLSREG